MPAQRLAISSILPRLPGGFGKFQLTLPGSFDPERVNRSDFVQRGFE